MKAEGKFWCLKSFLCQPFSKKARNTIKDLKYKRAIQNLCLIMTLVVKDEEDIIEKSIRFHKEMGVDGFIVTSHNSTDKTNEILKKFKEEGIVLEIFYETVPQHMHNVWVNRMIKLAKKKYKADWVINADADEFYYSKSLNLKESIMKSQNTNANVLVVDSTFIFPDDRDDFLNCSYFVTKPFQKFEADMLGLADKKYSDFIGSQGCTKVIHKTKGYKRIAMGNHCVKMFNTRDFYTNDVVLYHYHIRNYKSYTERIKRWEEAAKYMGKGIGEHTKAAIKLYREGKLKDYYDSLYGDNMRKFLIEEGVVSIDKSVSNFLKWKGII